MKKIYPIIIILTILLQLLSLIGFIYNTKLSNKEIQIIKVPYAKIDIERDTFVTTDMIDYKEVDKNTLDDDVLINITDILNRTTINNVNQNNYFTTNTFSPKQITFIYIQNHNDHIDKPFLNYNNINFYYLDENNSLEIIYNDTKYTIEDSITLNIISLDEILSYASTTTTYNNGKLYKYNDFEILSCNNNKLFISKSIQKENYCE